MRIFLTVMLPLLFNINAIGQGLGDSLGFTNRKEAENKTINGLKEGKWIEYYAWESHIVTGADTSVATDYSLIIYKAGKPYGIVREYNITFWYGKLESETRYKNGKPVSTRYYHYDKNGNRIPN